MKKVDNKLSALDQAIEAERRTVAKLQAGVQLAREEERTAEQQQGKLAYAALGAGESQAKTALTEAEDVLARSQARAKSAAIALQASQEKLESLQAERHQVFIEQKRQEYLVEAVELIRTDAEELETALTLMGASREGIRNRLRRMEQLALDCGIDTARVHNRVRENLRHCIEQRAQLESTWMSKQTRDLFKGPVSTVLQATLKGLVPEIEGQERTVKMA